METEENDFLGPIKLERAQRRACRQPRPGEISILSSPRSDAFLHSQDSDRKQARRRKSGPKARLRRVVSWPRLRLRSKMSKRSSILTDSCELSIWFKFNDWRKVHSPKARGSGELTMVVVSWFISWIL